MHNLIKREFKLKTSSHGREFLGDITAQRTSERLPVIVFVHGFKGFKDWGHFNLMAEKFAGKGFAFVKFNFSHNGTTIEDPLNFVDLDAFGHNTFSKELDDIDTVLQFIESQPWSDISPDPDRMYLVGHSRGGGTVLIKASEDERIKKVVSWAAVHDFSRGFSDDMVERWKSDGVHYIDNARTGQQMPLYLGIYHDMQKNKERLSPMRAVKNMKKPVLIIHGTKDPTVPVDAARLLKSQNEDAELHIIEDADHVFGGTHPFDRDDLHPHTYNLLDKTVSFLS